MSAASPLSLTALRQTIRRLERADGPAHAVHAHLPFGCPALDSHLPGGGLETGALHEVLGGRSGATLAVSTAFIAAICARMSGAVLWCGAYADLYGPGLASVGLAPDRLLIAAARDDDQILAVLEEGLRHRALAAVVGELKRLDLTASRRLQLAAAKSGVSAFVLRRFASDKHLEANAAVTRWRVHPAPSVTGTPTDLSRACWSLDLLRCRGATSATWIVEAPDATGHLRLPSTLDARSAHPAHRLSAAG